MDYAIKIENLSKFYPSVVALKKVDLAVKKGSIHGFLGPNGAGKSTTMKIIAGLLQQTDGTVEISGKIGFLPEHPPVYPNMSVQSYLEFVFDIYADDFTNKEQKIKRVMDKTSLITVKDRLIGNLSKGYQQRVGIAQAIIHSPEIIILDEPTVGLDPVAIAEIRNLILDLKAEHTVLFSSHQLHEVELLCSDITLINNGEIVISGAIDEILKNLQSQMKIKVQTLHFDEEMKKQLKNQFKIHTLSYEKDEERKLYNLEFSVESDIRVALNRALVNLGAEVLEFRQEKSDLEDLFKKII